MDIVDPYSFLCSVAVFLCVCIFAKYNWDRRKLYLFARTVSGPLSLPVVGNGLKFFCEREKLLNVLLEVTEPYPSPVRLWLGPKLVLFVKDPDQLQTFLQSTKMTTKAFVYRFLEPFLGKGLLTVSGPKHKIHRRILQPLFAQKMIDGYGYLFQKHANKFVDDLKKHADGTEFDISFNLQYTAFESAMDLLCEDKNEHSVDYKEVPEFVRRFYTIFYTRITTFWLHLDFIFKWTSYYKDQMFMKNVATTMIDEIMTTRVPEIVERLLDEKKVPVDNKDIKMPSMLELIAEKMIENPNCLTIQECTDHLMTFMGTSQDTQGTAIAFTCMMLGAYPHIQERVIAELKEIVGNKTTIDPGDVSKLKYLDMCIKETMRLFPVIPFLFRDTTEDFQLDKLTIPQNVTIVLSIFHVHRDPRYWEKPSEFYPEHFTPEAVSKRHPFAFIPFSSGPRRCIAQLYSYHNIKIMLSTILLKYEIGCRYKLEDIKLTTDISIRPIEGYKITLKTRSL